MGWHGDKKTYRQLLLLLIDAPKTLRPPTDDSRPDPKGNWNYRKVAEVFLQRFANSKVVSINMADKDTEADFMATIDKALADKTEEDLIVPYFQGEAGGEEEDYQWKIVRTGGKPKRVNAFNILQKFYAHKSDFYCALDSYFADRWSKKGRERLQVGWDEQHKEIMTTNTQFQDDRGKEGTDYEKGLSDSLISFLPCYIDQLVEGFEKGKRMKYSFTSIPQVLRKDEGRCSNASSPFRRQPGKPYKQVIMRFKFDPNETRKTGKIELFSELIQGSPEGHTPQTTDTGTATPGNDSSTSLSVPVAPVAIMTVQQQADGGEQQGNGEEQQADGRQQQGEAQEDEGVADMDDTDGDKATPTPHSFLQ